MASSLSVLPLDFVLGVHDLAAIILDAHSRTESLFPNAQLVEVNRGVTSLATLPSHVSPPDWHHTANGQKRLAYILKKDSHAIGVKTPAGRELTRRDLEDAYWRCKTFNNDYARLRARTSAKHEVVCKPSDVTVAEIIIVPNEAYLMFEYEPLLHLGPDRISEKVHLSGFDGAGMPWVYLLIGEPKSIDLVEDPRVVLDLVMS